jgi:eukaryotic-like serine/threonine-protein kinase
VGGLEGRYRNPTLLAMYPPSMPNQPFTPGTLLRNRYRIGTPLASGRATVTLAAADIETGRPCVVKGLSVGEVIRTASGSDSYDEDDFTKLIDLFEREARILAHLDHPGIPRLLDHFREETPDESWLYIVLDYVEGETLESLVQGGKHFTEKEARAVCRRVAEILAYIHGRSPPLIHRDIKPSNILLDREGQVHLVDFGSVRTRVGVGDSDGKTIVGTFGYMPIEQFEGRAGPASDIYALGATLLYMLSHREPQKMPKRGLRTDFRPLVNISDDFAALIEVMIEPDVEARFQSAEALIAALDGRTLITEPPRVILRGDGIGWLGKSRAARRRRAAVVRSRSRTGEALMGVGIAVLIALAMALLF